MLRFEHPRMVISAAGQLLHCVVQWAECRRVLANSHGDADAVSFELLGFVRAPVGEAVAGHWRASPRRRRTSAVIAIADSVVGLQKANGLSIFRTDQSQAS